MMQDQHKELSIDLHTQTVWGKQERCCRALEVLLQWCWGPLLQYLSQGSVCKVELCFAAHRFDGKGAGKQLCEKQPLRGEKNPLQNVRSDWEGRS